MGVFFGTDGLRGKIGDDLTHDIAYRCGNALGKLYPRSKVLIGRDTRISGDYIVLSFASGLISAGGDVTYISVCPTPGIAYLTHILGYDFGVSITASHNPQEYNGIKIFDSNFKKIADKKEEAIEKNFFQNILVPNEKLGKIRFQPNLVTQYRDFLLSHAPNLNNMKIILDCANGATGEIAKDIFEKAGAEVTAICSNSTGLDINLNCGATSTDKLREALLSSHADIGFAFDGDGDRVIAIDSKGNMIDGDQIIYILATYYKSLDKLSPSIVVGTRHTNMGMELALKRKGIDLIRADIGDKFVSAKLSEYNLKLGGEQSGHIIIRDALPTGDGILSALKLCEALITSQQKLSSMLDYTPYVQCNINVKVDNKLNIINSEKLNSLILKYEQALNTSGRIMVRLSGTEPVIRIMVESEDKEACDSIAKDLENMIKKIDKELNLCVE